MQSTQRSFLFGGLLGAAASAAVVFFVMDASGSGSVARPALAPGAPDARTPAPLVQQASGEERAIEARPASTKVDVRVDMDAVEAIVAERAAPAPAAAPSGEGAIWGRVLDESGKGLADVVVRAHGVAPRETRHELPSSVGGDAPPVNDLDRTVRAAVESYEETRARMHETKSDAAGAYRFDDLAAGDWRIEAFRRDWQIAPADGSSREVSTGTELDLRARPVITIPVEIVRDDGALLERAVLECDGERGRDGTYAWTPAEPVLRLTPGRYEVVARSGGFATSRGSAYDLGSEPQRVDVAAGAAPAPLRFVLETRTGIRGRITLPRDGVTGTYPRVMLAPLARGAEPDLDALAESNRGEGVAGGREFAFLDLEPGRYVVGASRTYESPIETHQVVEVTEGIVRCDLVLPELDLSSFLVVSVTGSDGSTLDGVEFRLEHKRDGGSNSWGTNGLRASDGRYLVAIRAEMREAYFSDAGASDRFALGASHERHGTKDVELQPGQGEVAISFAVPGRLEVVIPGYSGSAVDGRLTIDVARATGDDGGVRYWSGRESGRISSEGVQVFEAVEPGAYTIRMWLAPRDASQRRGRSWTLVHSEPITIASGPNGARLPLPTLYEVVVSHPDADEGATLRLAREGDPYGGSQAELDADGRAVFEDVVAGHYTLQCWQPYGQMEIDVPCGVVTFDAQVLDAVRVTVNDPSGTLAAAGFADGDLIVAIDGVEIEGQEDMFLLWRKRKDLTVSVLRGGARVDLSIVELDLRSAGDLGGQLQPASR